MEKQLIIAQRQTPQERKLQSALETRRGEDGKGGHIRDFKQQPGMERQRHSDVILRVHDFNCHFLTFYVAVYYGRTADSDTTSFLIYNEDHNKCMHAVNATVVQAAPCDASSKAQHFKWLSSSQIISLSFNLCLGSEKIKNWVKIILLPCNDSSPVQTWECKRTGVWSHWQIYVTKENLCSRGYQEKPEVCGSKSQVRQGLSVGRVNDQRSLPPSIPRLR
ncbi:Macrophage mannose receptor 1 [Labeo rohita]|uniref:Macrophage mannose receptor 1 n=1 Tax=Labeo rohita TaxID=84645 RepID=A0ABQ8MGQ4_LABRO|nr:Macrophage mannose receptor 1 [Labeo rohita]